MLFVDSPLKNIFCLKIIKSFKAFHNCWILQKKISYQHHQIYVAISFILLYKTNLFRIFLHTVEIPHSRLKNSKLKTMENFQKMSFSFSFLSPTRAFLKTYSVCCEMENAECIFFVFSTFAFKNKMSPAREREWCLKRSSELSRLMLCL